MNASERFRHRLASIETDPLLIPGGGTPLEARVAEQSGFDAFYLSGYAVAAWRHGLPDIGLLGARETLDALAAVRRVTELPLICDADTGYGDVIAVTENLRAMEAAGASAIQIEDQVWPKKCGHMSGKEVIAFDEAVRKVAAAVQARRNPDTVVIARTDSLAPRGLDEAIRRGEAFADAGADIVFIDAPEAVEQLATIGSAFGPMTMANMSEGGRTPALSLAELHQKGFGVVIYPTTTLRIAAREFGDFYKDLAADGSSASWMDRMHGLDGLNAIVDLDRYLAIDARFQGQNATT
ncbi:hypothetical protein B7R21_06080 [Subtercola boreus]|uniref:Carboxyvinyl-carboxyphosphonate phosphorylmutase n=1 Tax=Subtercola boreus TaxID=120213 RepID=A0A3E0W0L2_9MICO|nr:isocitrate lyase/phosphoenolpyruvate mutase family protein [Subtercola boreus]RFA14607.1 hypothetical protein B7R21_06080 [Subtercola boreus]